MKKLTDLYKNSVVGQSSTTLCYCIKFILNNGKTIAFTTNTRDIKFIDEDVVYKTSSFTPTASSKTSDMSVDNLDSNIIINHDDFKIEDLEKGVFSGAKFEYFRMNYSLKNPSVLDIDKINFGVVGEVSRQKGLYKLELRGKEQHLQTKVNDTIKPSCSHMLYDDGCQVLKSNHIFSDKIGTIYSNTKFDCINLVNNNDDFNYGIIEFIDGEAAGISAEVKYWKKDGKIIELQLPINYNLKPGDSFNIYRGCDKTIDTCTSKFNNAINFDGFPDLPGIDKLMGGS